MVAGRSKGSLIEEAKRLTKDPRFKGYIHDVGGPTANFFLPACRRQEKQGSCRDRQCLYPKPCKNLQVSHKEYLEVLRGIRKLPGVKKVFVRSGIRYDYLLAERDETFLEELLRHHVSGRLKVAPEHTSPAVLNIMRKPSLEVYEAFCRRFSAVNRRLGLKQYLVPYLISSHPGSTLTDAIQLAEYLRDHQVRPEQVQDFYPVPGTLSTAMYYTGVNPLSGEPLYVAKKSEDKRMQRALLQYYEPGNHALVRKALRLCGREDLIGKTKKALVPDQPFGKDKKKKSGANKRRQQG